MSRADGGPGRGLRGSRGGWSGWSSGVGPFGGGGWSGGGGFGGGFGGFGGGRSGGGGGGGSWEEDGADDTSITFGVARGGDAAGGSGLVRVLVQPLRLAGRSDQDAVGAGREPAPAPQ